MRYGDNCPGKTPNTHFATVVSLNPTSAGAGQQQRQHQHLNICMWVHLLQYILYILYMIFVLAGQLYTGHTACLRATSLRQYINYIVGIDGVGHVASHTHTYTQTHPLPGNRSTLSEVGAKPLHACVRAYTICLYSADTLSTIICEPISMQAQHDSKGTVKFINNHEYPSNALNSKIR